MAFEANTAEEAPTPSDQLKERRLDQWRRPRSADLGRGWPTRYAATPGRLIHLGPEELNAAMGLGMVGFPARSREAGLPCRGASPLAPERLHAGTSRQGLAGNGQTATVTIAPTGSSVKHRGLLPDSRTDGARLRASPGIPLDSGPAWRLGWTFSARNLRLRRGPDHGH